MSYNICERDYLEGNDEVITFLYIAKSIGAYVIKTRNEQNITQTQLANSANITSANLSRLEKGQSNVTIDTLNRVFVALGKTLKLVE